MELHQIFLDMAVLVEAQGEMLDNIEAQVGGWAAGCVCSAGWVPALRLPGPGWEELCIPPVASAPPQKPWCAVWAARHILLGWDTVKVETL